jgi:hypothetical protein
MLQCAAAYGAGPLRHRTGRCNRETRIAKLVAGHLRKLGFDAAAGRMARSSGMASGSATPVHDLDQPRPVACGAFAVQAWAHPLVPRTRT